MAQYKTGTIIIDLTGNVDADVVSTLLERPYLGRNHKGKEIILQRDRPKPSLEGFLMEPQKKEPVGEGFWQLEFDSWWYANFLWLCGSRFQNGVFCWPCLLYHETENMWTRGVRINKNVLTEMARAHEITDDHKRCVVTLKVERDTYAINFLFTKGVVYPDKLSIKDKPQRKSMAKMNRILFERTIDVVMMIFNTDFAWRFLFTNTSSSVKLKAMIDLAIQQDDDLKQHCEKLGDTFLQTLTSFFKHIMLCMKIELQFFIPTELLDVKPHPFWSVQVDGATDGNGKHIGSVRLRYVHSSGILQEYLIGFTPKNNKSAADVFEYASSWSTLLAHHDYLVSQSYDGSCILVDELLELQNKYTAIAPGAVLVPSIEHSINIVLLQGVTSVPGIAICVAILEDFLSNNQKNVLLYKSLKLSPTEQTHLALDCHLLRHILQERSNFIDDWKEKQCSMHTAPQDQWIQASMFANHLKDVKFVSALLVFAKILESTDEVSNAFSRDRTDVKSCSSVTKQAIMKLKQISSQKLVSKAYLLVNGSRELSSNKSFRKLVTLHNSVIENITIQLSIRYGNSYRQLTFLSLADSTKFASHHKNFPENALASLQRLYKRHFGIEWLRRELKVFIYSDKQFYNQSPMAIIKLLIANDMKELLPESFKLFCLVATIPVWSETCLDSLCIDRRNALLQSSNEIGKEETMWMEASTSIVNKPIVLRLAAMGSWHTRLLARYAMETNKYDLDD